MIIPGAKHFICPKSFLPLWKPWSLARLNLISRYANRESQGYNTEANPLFTEFAQCSSLWAFVVVLISYKELTSVLTHEILHGHIDPFILLNLVLILCIFCIRVTGQRFELEVSFFRSAVVPSCVVRWMFLPGTIFALGCWHLRLCPKP